METRMSEEGDSIRRRRSCSHCEKRFTTYERADVSYPAVVKKDGRRIEYDRSKLRGSLNLALRKRPVSTEQIDAAIERIEDKLLTLSQREGMNEVSGYRLVGVKPVNPAHALTAGAHFLAPGAVALAVNDGGWLTSVVYSPHLGHSIALGYLKGGDTRIGERLRVVNLLAKTDVEVEIVSPHFFDPEGGRLRG